jgi:hypothetical protein
MIVFGAVLWIYEKLERQAFLKYARQPMRKGWLAEQIKWQRRESQPPRAAVERCRSCCATAARLFSSCIARIAACSAF